MRIVTILRLVLHVRRRNRDPALAFFRRIVNLIVRLELTTTLFYAITFVIAAVNVVLP